MKSVEGLPTVYLFVGRKSEATLCSEFVPVISQSLDVFVPNEIRTFLSLFQYLMELASNKPFNLVIDEFQEFYNINESVYSDMQNSWDTYRKKSRMNLIVSGSVYSLMQKIFQHAKEPLFGTPLFRVSAKTDVLFANHYASIQIYIFALTSFSRFSNSKQFVFLRQRQHFEHSYINI